MYFIFLSFFFVFNCLGFFGVFFVFFFKFSVIILRQEKVNERYMYGNTIRCFGQFLPGRERGVAC